MITGIDRAYATRLATNGHLTLQKQAGHLQLDDPGIVAPQFVLLLTGEAAFPTMPGSFKPFGQAAAVERIVSLMLRACSASTDPRSGSADYRAEI